LSDQEFIDIDAINAMTREELAANLRTVDGLVAEAKALIRYAIEDIRGRTPDYDMRAAMLRFVEEEKT
jgi:hypothetical protein